MRGASSLAYKIYWNNTMYYLDKYRKKITRFAIGFLLKKFYMDALKYMSTIDKKMLSYSWYTLFESQVEMVSLALFSTHNLIIDTDPLYCTVGKIMFYTLWCV